MRSTNPFLSLFLSLSLSLSRGRRAAAVGAALVAALLPSASPGVAAGGATTLYAYDLAGASSRVSNQGSAYGEVPLELQGNWWSGPDGVSFAGDTSGKRSVGVADPPSGATIDVAGSDAVGAAATFTWAPASGSTCPKDSRNVLQVGRFAAGQAQVKLQLGRCWAGAVRPQCRVAGGATPKGAPPVTGNGTIEPGVRYRLECVKSPDQGTTATVTVRLTRLDTGATTTKRATIPDTGRIRTWKQLSVANKYPMPSPAANTDQFVGTVRRVAICAGGGEWAVRSCLGTAAPG